MAFLEKFQPSDHHFKQNSSKKNKSGALAYLTREQKSSLQNYMKTL